MNWNDDQSLATIVQAVTEFEKTHSHVSGWAINGKASDACQSLLLGGNANTLSVYQDREVDDLSYRVTLYVTSDDQTEVGASSATILLGGDLLSQLEQIKANASLAMNPAYPLADQPKSPYPAVESYCPLIVADMNLAHKKLIERVQLHAALLQNVQVNSAELYTNVHHHLLKTSQGIEAQKITTDLYFEVAMELTPGPNLQEVLKYWHFVGVNDADVEAKLDEVAQETQLTTEAFMPPARESATILVDSYAISKIAAAIASQLNGSAEYSKGPHLKPNDTLPSGEVDASSDQLNLTIDPTLKQMAKTSAFTDEGTVAEKAHVIVDNKVQQQVLDTRLAHYLSKAPNGIYGNLVIPAGTASRTELLNYADEVIEILDFSSLLVNPSSLTWSSEIKLGRLYKNGQPVKTLKGGIVSGNVRDSLTGFKFSSETTSRNTAGGYFEAASGYQGPTFMLMWNGISIAGETDQETL
jgi:predicted Zn-dependent protease